MTVSEIRARYLAFMRERGHMVLPSQRLVPENDPTTLFTSSGMQPLLPYFLGQPHPQGTRVVNSQKCLRAQDVEEVGDNRHTTFFEMLGNWSFGDYFKEEQLSWFYAFLTHELGINPEKLYVTVFIGDESLNIPKDAESIAIWKRLFGESGIDNNDIEISSEMNGYAHGMQGARIFAYDAKKNWWSRAGSPDLMPAGEPGGPDSEVFYDFGTPHDTKYGANCHPNCDCGRFMEIGNSVFMEYLKQEDGSFAKLPKANVDFGGGLERIAAAVEAKSDVFLVDCFLLIIRELASQSSKSYTDPKYQKSFRVVADHMRAATFMIADGVRPSNTEQGYVLRRFLRRAVRHLDHLGIGEGTAERVSKYVVDSYKDQYPELLAAVDMAQVIRLEEDKFRKTLAAGMKEFQKMSSKGDITGDDAFILFTTYGFPVDVTEELAHESGRALDKKTFNALMDKHRNDSRAGSVQKFAGGLADHSEQTVKYHTTHHLLLKALQIVLGPHVKQRGSNITSERLRIDFSFDRKMTPEEIAEVEKIVNEKIREGLPVTRTVMPKVDAEKLGAEHEFGVKYPDTVSVYSVGPREATQDNPRIENAYSIEFCGGPHVSNTLNIASDSLRFKIKKEEAVQQGVRRIKAVVE